MGQLNDTEVILKNVGNHYWIGCEMWVSGIQMNQCIKCEEDRRNNGGFCFLLSEELEERSCYLLRSKRLEQGRRLEWGKESNVLFHPIKF